MPRKRDFPLLLGKHGQEIAALHVILDAAVHTAESCCIDQEKLQMNYRRLRRPSASSLTKYQLKQMQTTTSNLEAGKQDFGDFLGIGSKISSLNSLANVLPPRSPFQVNIERSYHR